MRVTGSSPFGSSASMFLRQMAIQAPGWIRTACSSDDIGDIKGEVASPAALNQRLRVLERKFDILIAVAVAVLAPIFVGLVLSVASNFLPGRRTTSPPPASAGTPETEAVPEQQLVPPENRESQ